MGKRVLGTFVGICASLVGVVAWIVIGMFGYVAGVAGFLIGVLFCAIYRLLNSEDRGVYCYVVAAVVMVVEIILSELLLVLMLGIPLQEAFADATIRAAIIVDILVGLVASAIGFILYCISDYRKRRKRQQEKEELAARLVAMMQAETAVEETETAVVETETVAVETEMAQLSDQEATAAQTEAATQTQLDDLFEAYPQGEVKTKKITIFREKSFIGMAVALKVTCDDREVGKLKNGGTIELEVTNVPHRIEVSGGLAVSSVPYLTEANEMDEKLVVYLKSSFWTSDIVIKKIS